MCGWIGKPIPATTPNRANILRKPAVVHGAPSKLGDSGLHTAKSRKRETPGPTQRPGASSCAAGKKKGLGIIGTEPKGKKRGKSQPPS